MFDQRVLEYLNERAHMQSVARAAGDGEYKAFLASTMEREKPAVEQPMVFPLTILAGRLQVGPPLITYLMDIFSSGDTIAEFRDLVREYLPEHEAAILAEPISRRVASFVRFFSQAYFPLSDEMNDPATTMGELLGAIPVDYMGYTEADYHAFNDFRTGYIILLSLAENRYDEWDEEDEGSPGGRVALIERVGELVGPQLAQLIPKEGWSTEYLHEMTDGTKFEGCGNFADWINANTGLWLLDTTQVDYELGEVPGEEWTMDTVETLAEEWPRAGKFWDKLNLLATLLESDLVNNFRELLTLLVDDKEKIIPKEQIPLSFD